MTQGPLGKEMKVSEIERLVMPAILQKRFHTKYAQVPDMRQPGVTTLQPVAVEIKLPVGSKLSGDDITVLDCSSTVSYYLVYSLPTVTSAPE